MDARTRAMDWDGGKSCHLRDDGGEGGHASSWTEERRIGLRQHFGEMNKPIWINCETEVGSREVKPARRLAWCGKVTQTRQCQFQRVPYLSEKVAYSMSLLEGRELQFIQNGSGPHCREVCCFPRSQTGLLPSYTHSLLSSSAD